MYFKASLLVGIAVQFSSCNVFVPLHLPSPFLSPSYPLYSTPGILNPYQTYPVASDPVSSSSYTATPSPLLAASTYSGWNCNELEKKINNERRRYGMKDLLCDQHMRWTANQHVEDQADAGFNGFNQADKSCNLHSWFSKYSCCYRSGADNGGCMTDKPFVSILGAIVFSCYSFNIIIMT